MIIVAHPGSGVASELSVVALTHLHDLNVCILNYCMQLAEAFINENDLTMVPVCC